ncbi:MAG TPA: dihydrodipicolinate reductase [Anaerolineae bacterium]|nr:dihydrodipicolinate reductase [Anaerolineae bacterium]
MRREKIRVIHYGLGPIGSLIARIVAERPGLEIVGAIDIAPDKAGRDIGEVIGLGHELGVIVSADAAATLRDTKADVTIHAIGSYLEREALRLKAVIEAGISVVSTCEELAYPRFKHPQIAAELDALAREHGVTVLGTGVNPGFIQDTIAVVLSGICHDVRRIRVYRRVDTSERRENLQRKAGAGLTVDEFRAQATAGGVHVGLTQSLQAIAEAIGWKLDRVEETVEPVVAEETVRSQFFEVQPGRVKGLHQVARGWRDEEEVLTLDLLMYIGLAEPEDEVIIEGTRPLEMRIRGVHGDAATAAIVVNAIPRVLNAPPGLVTMTNLPIVSATLCDCPTPYTSS